MEKVIVNLFALTFVILKVEASCSRGAIRLAGSYSYQGRVELCYNNIWGTVCDDNWSSNDGIVVCRQLGLRFIRVFSSAYFGRGIGRIWLDDVGCTGYESRLIDCRHRGFGVHNCGHSEDAGVVCAPRTSYITCTTGNIRLVNGASRYQGRVEVCYNNVWGTVCDDGWSRNDGIVACRQLGRRFVSITTSARFGQGRGQIWLDNLLCTGSETQLIRCRHNGFGRHNCGHSEDAGVICSTSPYTSSTPSYTSTNRPSTPSYATSNRPSYLSDYDGDDESDGVSEGAIAGISVGSAIVCIVIIIVVITCSVSVGCYYVKRQNGTCDLPTTNVITNENCNVVPPMSTQQPVTVVSYANNCASVTTPCEFNNVPLESSQELEYEIPSTKPPEYNPKSVHVATPAAQHVVH